MEQRDSCLYGDAFFGSEHAESLPDQVRKRLYAQLQLQRLYQVVIRFIEADASRSGLLVFNHVAQGTDIID